MNLPSDYDIPTSFDPAIHLHSECHNASVNPDSADLLELNRHLDEVRQQKTRDGVVIQHRAWKAQQAFLSEEDYLTGKFLPVNCTSGAY
jgi:chromosome transmission fidelity protein 18